MKITLFAKVLFFICARLRPPENYDEHFSESLLLLLKGFLCRRCFALLHLDDLESKMSSGVNLAVNWDTYEWAWPLVIASFYTESPAAKHKMEEQKKPTQRFVELEWVLLITLNSIWTVKRKGSDLNREPFHRPYDERLNECSNVNDDLSVSKKKEQTTYSHQKLSRRFATAWLTHLWRKYSCLIK